jgi:hypothetical protein
MYLISMLWSSQAIEPHCVIVVRMSGYDSLVFRVFN